MKEDWETVSLAATGLLGTTIGITTLTILYSNPEPVQNQLRAFQLVLSQSLLSLGLMSIVAATIMSYINQKTEDCQKCQD